MSSAGRSQAWPFPLCFTIVQKDRLAPFEELLNAGIDPDDDIVEAAVGKDDERFLLRLLQHSWPIDKALRGGKVPSLLWQEKTLHVDCKLSNRLFAAW